MSVLLENYCFDIENPVSAYDISYSRKWIQQSKMIDMLCSVHSTISFQGFKEDAVWMIEMADEGEEMHKISRFFLRRIMTTYKIQNVK